MVTKEDVEQLMLQHFPSCPLCKAKSGYEVSGIFKNYVRCKSCEAQWVSTDFVACKELNVLRLWKTARDGRGKRFKKKEHPVSFWQQMMHAKDETEFLERRTLIEELFTKMRKDFKTRNETRKRLRKIGQPVFVILNGMLNIRNRMPIRFEALELLGLIEDERGMDLLIPALKQDQDPNISVLDMRHARARDDTQATFRLHVARVLGVLEQANKTGKAVEPLIWSLKNDLHPNVRAGIAMQVFANPEFPVFTKDLRVIEALNQALTDSEHTKRGGSLADALYARTVGPPVGVIARQALSIISYIRSQMKEDKN